MNVSPAKNELRTNGTVRSTRGLSCGRRTRAGSMWNPRAWAYSTNAWFNRGCQRVGVVDDRRQVVGDHRGEHAAEERPRRFEPVDHVLGGLTERQPHEAVPRVAGGEDQRLHHPAPPALGVDDEAPSGRSRPAARRPARHRRSAPSGHGPGCGRTPPARSAAPCATAPRRPGAPAARGSSPPSDRPPTHAGDLARGGRPAAATASPWPSQRCGRTASTTIPMNTSLS